MSPSQTEPPTFAFSCRQLIDEERVSQDEITWVRDNLQDAPALTDEQIALFVLSCDRDLKFTLITIKAYFAARNNAPQLFNGRDVEREELKYQLGVIRYSVFPKHTPDGCAVLYHSLYDFSAWHYVMEHSMKLLFMTLDATVYDQPVPTGLVILFDMRGVGLMHLTRVRLSAVRTFCQYLQEGLPVKLQDIHVLNTAYFIDKVHAILRPFVKKELYERIHFHPPSLSMEEFHEKHIPKNCLPSDFSGDLPSLEELHEVNTQKLLQMRPYFDAEERQRVEYFAKSKK